MKTLLRQWCLLLGLTFGLISCRPNLQPDAPTGLRFDQKRDDNLTKLHKLSQVTGVRLFWWNVAWGSFNGSADLDHNLIELINSNARPDILILGEFKDMVLAGSTHQELRNHYQYQYFNLYSSSSAVGVKVYSIRKLTAHGARNIPWYPIEMTDVEHQRIYHETWNQLSPSEVTHWDRSVEFYSFSHGGKTFTLAPVHLLEPWAAILSANGGMETVKRFINGTKNPLVNQIKHLRALIKRHAGSLNNVLLIGDFNIPKSYYGLTPPIYSILAQDFTEGHFGNPDTFPAESARSRVHGILQKVSIKIDHALLGNNLDRIGGAAIHLRGSDHYPIYVVVAPKTSSFWSWW